MTVSSNQVKFAVIGDPIAQSPSPEIHLPVLKKYLENPSYERVLVKPEDLGAWVKRAREEGYLGFNVTMPHKMTIGAYLDEVVMEADLTGSVNTVVNRDGKLIGYSTDALGFFAAARENGILYEDKRIVILGAGGSASALAYRAILDGAYNVTVLARRREQAKKLVLAVRSHNRYAALSWGGLNASELQGAMERADLIINTTPLGMQGYESDWADLSFLEHVSKHAAVCDIIHSPEQTSFLKKASELGLKTQNGMDMLIYQALAADHLYLNCELDYPAMAKLVRESLGETR